MQDTLDVERLIKALVKTGVEQRYADWIGPEIAREYAEIAKREGALRQ